MVAEGLMEERSGTIDWRRPACWALLVLWLAGCDTLGTTSKHKNPVVPPPPRWRMKPNEADDSEPRTSVEGDAAQSTPTGGRAALAARPTTAKPAGKRSPPRDKATENIAVAEETAPTDDEPGARPGREAPLGGPWKSVAQTSASRPVAGPKAKGPTRPRVAAAEMETETETTAEDRPPTDDDPTALKLGLETEGAGEPVEKGEVAAMVNGVPIFVEEVLFQFGPNVTAARQQLSPEDFRKWRANLIKNAVAVNIERELLLQQLKLKLKEENLAGLIKQIDSQYKEDLTSQMKRLGVSTQGELEMQLRKQGQSIEFLKAKFRNQHLAHQYLMSRTIPRSGFDLPDLHEYYQSHLEKYAIPARVKWQQIHLIYSKHDGKEATRKLADEVLARLEADEDFAALAREVSDGPTKASGGHWGWTSENNVKSKALDEALFTMPIGSQFALIEGADAIDIVVVLARNEAGYKSFASVQDEIKQQLRNAEYQRAAKEVFAELRAKATIETFTDTF